MHNASSNPNFGEWKLIIYVSFIRAHFLVCIFSRIPQAWKLIIYLVFVILLIYIIFSRYYIDSDYAYKYAYVLFFYYLLICVFVSVYDGSSINYYL